MHLGTHLGVVFSEQTHRTIPIAKRRYYGRVQQAVHDFLAMGPDVVKGDMTANKIQFFFDPQGVVVVPAKRKDIAGVCTKKDNDCRGKEIRDSRYNDMVRITTNAHLWIGCPFTSLTLLYALTH